MTDINKALQTAKSAAVMAGNIHMKYFGKIHEVDFKANEFDIVTQTDKESEKLIIEHIRTNFPEHSILAEESGKADKESDYLWIIDPLDGTVNYSHNFPHFAVSIALYYKGKPLIGVVYDSFKKELFHACKGGGAFLNEKPIKVSPKKELFKSLLATGFPTTREEVLRENLGYFTKFLKQAQAVRRPGAAALDLAYVAVGRLDGFWEMSLSPWDVAAGRLIVEEAGGKVTNFDSEDFDYDIRRIIASNGFIHEKIKEVINA